MHDDTYDEEKDMEKGNHQRAVKSCGLVPLHLA
jgi:hypothetical protein